MSSVGCRNSDLDALLFTSARFRKKLFTASGKFMRLPSHVFFDAERVENDAERKTTGRRNRDDKSDGPNGARPIPALPQA